MESYTLNNKTIKAVMCDIDNYTNIQKELLSEGFKAHIILNSNDKFHYIEISETNENIARPCYCNLSVFNYVLIIETEDSQTHQIVKHSTIMPEAQFNLLFKKKGKRRK